MNKKPTDVLARPIEVHSHRGTILAPVTREEARVRLAEEFVPQALERLMALFEHYKIPDLEPSEEKKNWAALALHLAMEYHPAFKVLSAGRRKRGRPRGRRDSTTLMQLLSDVESVKKGRLTDHAAVTHLTRSPKFAERWGRKNIETLVEDLRAARDPKQNVWLALIEHIKPEFREEFRAEFIKSWNRGEFKSRKLPD